MAKNKKQKTTIEKYRYWRNWDIGLTAAKFAMPLASFGTVLGVNWNQWVGDSASQGWSIGIGFGMLIIATLSAMLAIWKKDDIVKSKVSGVLYIAIIFVVIGFGFKCLASIMSEMGDMFLYVAIGLVASFGVDEADKLAVRPKVLFYKNLVEENGLSKSTARIMDDTEQARLEGEEAKKERKKAEKVRFIPHD